MAATTRRPGETEEAAQSREAAGRAADDQAAEGPLTSPGYEAELRRRQKAQTEGHREAYDQGHKAGEGEAGTRSPAPRHASRPAARRSSVPAVASRVADQVAVPTASAAGASSGIQVLGLTLGVVALYLFLSNAGYVTGFLGGISKALNWLASPTATIPYGPNR